MIRGLRGATTVAANDAGQIAERTRELIRLLVELNGMRPDDIASALFTATEDLDAAFPAVVARGLPEWKDVPLLCAREIPVPGSLGHCIRILIHWNTDRTQAEIRHVFLRGARHLRPEWAVRVPGDEEEESVRLPGKGG
jgi:chorismate mutase